MNKKSLLGTMAMLSELGGGFGLGGKPKVDYQKYVMGKDTLTPKRRWAKPIYGKTDHHGRHNVKIGMLVKYMDGTIRKEMMI